MNKILTSTQHGKMKKKVFFMGLAAVCGILALSSCSGDVTPEGDEHKTSAKPGISFTPVAGNAKATRGTATTPDNYLTQIANFKVWGWNSTSLDYYLGLLGEGGIIIDGNGTAYDYRTASEKAYWPSYALDFYAVTPAENSGYAYNATGGMTYTVPSDESKQVDVMVANAGGVTESTNNGVVALPFKHMLSQVRFNAKLVNSTLNVEIKGITIHNAKNTIDIDLRQGTVAQNSTTVDNYAVGLASPVTLSTLNESKSVTDDNGVLLLAPQTLTGWASKTTVYSADENKQCYLEIECKIKSGSTYLVGSADAYGKTYVAFPADWKSGSKYVYTLNFGVGLDENGNPRLTPITFSVTASDWGEQPEMGIGKGTTTPENSGAKGSWL